MAEEYWSERDTTPGAVEAALRELLGRWHARERAFAPARVLNLVVVVDAGFRGEVENRLERVGRFHPSRTVICAVTEGRRELDATALVTADDAVPEPGHLAVARERVELELGERHVRALESIVGPLRVPDLATLVWAPHGHVDALRSLRRVADVVLVDSLDEPEIDAALARAAEWTRDMYVVDLAWLRSTPWRERLAAAFDPPPLRAQLDRITGVSVRHRHGSEAAAALFCGWLASRLDWRPEPLLHVGNGWRGSAHARRTEVDIVLEPVGESGAPGLAGVTVATSGGETLSLDRGPGGLHTTRGEQRWTVLGASRGEAGILGEGVRQALLRDRTYGPALEAARAMVAR